MELLKLLESKPNTKIVTNVEDLKTFAHELFYLFSKNEVEKILTLQEASSYLNICRTKLWQLEKKGVLIPHRCGKKIYYYKNEIDDYIKNTNKYV